ncbi:hypothetical protein [Brevundimonas sp.]|uniref:hypothetical protein n=1 Tax=Brevundimonas sp. TaxID=1871086 RepID=UPI002D64463F|nr:hypothetical protein [Brevundimonas sp.]HYC74940.1 hypothetical protein [Brevundimonas sp.]
MSDRAVNASIGPRRTGLPGLACAAGLALAACGDRQPSAPPAPPEPAPQSTAPLADPILDRGAILSAVDSEASRAAAGLAPPASDPLANRRFRMRIAFGCLGPEAPPPEGVSDAGAPRWSRSADGRVIRLRFTPADWTAGDATGPAVEGFERVGGVWINQPWMRTGGCPAPGLPVMDTFALPASPKVGLALLRGEGASRLGRADDRAFTFTVRGQGDAPAPNPVRGYRLVLEGRLIPWAEGRVIRCRVARADSRPACAVGVVLDRLAYEDGATGETLSEWRPG